MESILPTLSNRFWVEVFTDFSTIVGRYKDNVQNIDDILSQCIWNNDDIKIGNKTVLYKTWLKRGIVFVNDLIDENGQCYSKEDLQNIYDLNTDFLTYEGIKRAVLQYARSRDIVIDKKLSNPIYPFIMRCTNTLLGHQKIYDMLLNSDYVRLPCYDKWENIISSTLPDSDWKAFSTIANKCTISTDLKWLQYRILHRLLPTNQFLFRIHYVDNPLCTFCKQTEETIYHIFWECNTVKRIWLDLKNWLNTVDVQLSFSNIQVIFGVKGKNNYALNAIIILVKNIIYKCTKKGIIPNFNYIKRQIAQYYYISKCAYTNLGQETHFLKFWSILHLLFRE